MPSFLPVAFIVMLVLCQGGFFGLAGCSIGLAACLAAGVGALSKRGRSAKIGAVPLLFMGIAGAYLASTVANGLTLTSLSETGVWAGVAALSLIGALQTDEQRSTSLALLAWAGIATALVGMLVHAGMLSMRGGMVVERLQFSFQYANAAGIWYATCTFLCLLLDDRRLSGMAALPATALLLTQSGGALLAFALVAGFAALAYARSGAWDRLLFALLQGVVSAGLFAALLMTTGWLELVVVALASAALWTWGSGLRSRGGDKGQAHHRLAQLDPRKASLILLGILAACAVAALVLLSSRVAEATNTFGERIYHIRDGLATWARSPLLGIGPDTWRFVYRYVQTAPYHATVVHSSYVQLLLDAGILGLACLGAAAVLGVRDLRHRGKDRAAPGPAIPSVELCAAALVFVHALIDFDLQFSSLAGLLAYLLSAPAGRSAQAPSQKTALHSLLKGAVCLALLVPMSLLGLLSDASLYALERANTTQDYSSCIRLFEGNPLARQDQAALDAYLEACYATGNYRLATQVFSSMKTPSDLDAIYAVLSYHMLQESEEAGQTLVEALEAQPCNTELARDAQQVVNVYGLDSALEARYEAALAHIEASSELL